MPLEQKDAPTASVRIVAPDEEEDSDSSSSVSGTTGSSTLDYLGEERGLNLAAADDDDDENDDEAGLVSPKSEAVIHALQTERTCKNACTPLAALVLVVLFVGAGHLFEGWHVSTSLYVLMQIVTTIGYGDVTPETRAMKIFLCVFVLAALLFMATLLTTYVQSFVDRSVDVFEDYLSHVADDLRKHDIRRQLTKFSKGGSDLTKAILGKPEDMGKRASLHRKVREVKHQLGNGSELVSASFILVVLVLLGAWFFSFVEGCSCSYGVNFVEGCEEDTFEHCKATGGEVKSFEDCFYMAMMTVTTIGFGDLSPQTRVGRWFAFVWCFFGVAACVNWLGTVTKILFERWRWQQVDVEYLNVDEATFREMDSSGNGTLSRFEFLQFALLRQGIVSREILGFINQIYDKMDPNDTDNVTFGQLLAVQRVRRKERFRQLSQRSVE